VLCGLVKDAEPVIHQIIGCSERVIQDVSARLPLHFAPHVADTVFQSLRRAAARLQAMPCT
jgi:hypothetical protein